MRELGNYMHNKMINQKAWMNYFEGCLNDWVRNCTHNTFWVLQLTFTTTCWSRKTYATSD
jgi:hypothetical protein